MDRERASDEELLQLYVEGDEAAFAALMQRHEDRIFGLAYRMLGDRSDALEATQETFISAFRQAATFRGDSAFGTWLYRVGINACRDLMRRRRRFPVAEEDPFAATGAPTPELRGIDEPVLDRMEIARALAQLPAEYREAVVMHDLGGIPYEEIATLTRAKIGTVKSRISRGRRMLAGLMEQPAGVRPSKEKR
ncbi:MAG: RNA polymerase sigma factor [Actinomycetota bacterium]